MRPQKPKSITAAEATHEINPDLQVEAHLNKVCPATESIYSDTFYSHSNVVITALDNVEARRYVDRSVFSQLVWKSLPQSALTASWGLMLMSSPMNLTLKTRGCLVMKFTCVDVCSSRCVSNQRPLLDSGTMGTKGHTEIIVPNLTESYNSHVSVWGATVCH